MLQTFVIYVISSYIFVTHSRYRRSSYMYFLHIYLSHTLVTDIRHICTFFTDICHTLSLQAFVIYVISSYIFVTHSRYRHSLYMYFLDIYLSHTVVTDILQICTYVLSSHIFVTHSRYLHICTFVTDICHKLSLQTIVTDTSYTPSVNDRMLH